MGLMAFLLLTLRARHWRAALDGEPAIEPALAAC
jgi:hypothetical protein